MKSFPALKSLGVAFLALPPWFAKPDDGDATSLASFRSPVRQAFSGKCLATARTWAGAPGTISVTAEAEGMPPAGSNR